MEIRAKWSTPIELSIATEENLIFGYQLKNIPKAPGCYVFFNKHGNSYSILYIGQTINLQKRLGQHQTDNVRLMVGIKRSLRGKKYLMYCTILTKKGQQRGKVLKILENALIKTAFSSGSEPLNKQGAKIPHHHITFSQKGNSKKLFERKINVEIKRSK